MIVESILIDFDHRYTESICFAPFNIKERYSVLHLDDKYYYVFDDECNIIFYDKRAFKIIDKTPIVYNSYIIVHKSLNIRHECYYEDDFFYLTKCGLLYKDEYQLSYTDNNINIVNKL